MTRPNHSVISNQLYASNTMDNEVTDMKAVVGESMEDHLYLAFLEQFGGKYVAQGRYCVFGNKKLMLTLLSFLDSLTGQAKRCAQKNNTAQR